LPEKNEMQDLLNLYTCMVKGIQSEIISTDNLKVKSFKQGLSRLVKEEAVVQKKVYLDSGHKMSTLITKGDQFESIYNQASHPDNSLDIVRFVHRIKNQRKLFAPKTDNNDNRYKFSINNIYCCVDRDTLLYVTAKYATDIDNNLKSFRFELLPEKNNHVCDSFDCVGKFVYKNIKETKAIKNEKSEKTYAISVSSLDNKVKNDIELSDSQLLDALRLGLSCEDSKD
jgi:hypothetical protein